MNPNHCLVTQNIAALIADSPKDLDRYPDIANVSGSVTFTPTTAGGQAYHLAGEDGKDFTVPITPVSASIKNGRIEHEGEPGVYLFAAGENSNPQSIVYRAVYSNLYAGLSSPALKLNTVTFEAVPGGVVDLTTVTPVAGTPSPGVTKGDKGDRGEQGPQGERGPQGTKGDKGDTGAKGEPGEVTLAQLNQAIRVDTSVGTRVFAGDTMIYGDTGRRMLTGWNSEGEVTYGTLPSGIVPTPGVGGGMYIRRVGDRVTISLIAATADSTTPSISIPLGFRVTSAPFPYINLQPARPSVTAIARVGANTIYLGGLTVGATLADMRDTYAASLAWDATQTWPTSLPGTPA